MNKRLILNFTLFGFISILAQVSLFRALLNLTGGNELTIAIALGGWFIGQALGNLIAIPLAKTREVSQRYLIISFIMLALLIPLVIVSIQVFHTSVGLTPGEVANLSVDVLASLIFITPVTLLLGGIFTFACRAGFEGAFAVPGIYIFEGVGSALGGLLATLSLNITLNTLLLGVFTGTFCALSALLFSYKKRPGVARLVGAVVSGLLIVIFIAGMVDGLWSNVYHYVRDRYGFQKLSLERVVSSPYGEISIVRDETVVSIYQSGSLISSHPNPFFVEETVYLPLLLQPHPENLLIIGGGVGGELDMALDFPLDGVVLLQKDDSLVEVAGELGLIPEDERLRIVSEDPVKYLGGEGDRYDVVILNVGDPSTAETNRYYTVEFLEMCKERLKDGGVMVTFADSDENYIGPDMADYLKSHRLTYERVFERVEVIPGGRAIFILTDDEELEINQEVLTERAKRYDISPQYFTPEYISYRFQYGRKMMFLRALEGASGIVNTYEKPIAYYFDLLLWTSRTSPQMRSFFRFNARYGDWWFIAVLGLVVLAVILVRRRRSTFLNASIFLGGFTAITFEIVLIVLYQSLLGDVYQDIALIFADFMLGLAVGGFISARVFGGGGRKLRSARWTLMAILGSLALFYIALPELVLSLNVSLVSFVIYTGIFIVSGMVGSLFSIASVMLDREGASPGGVGGILHSLDSLGALLGSIYATLLALPISGVFQVSVNISVLMAGLLAVGLVMGRR